MLRGSGQHRCPVCFIRCFRKSRNSGKKKEFSQIIMRGDHMLSIRKLTVERLEAGCVTDEKKPGFSFSVDSDRQGAQVKSALLTVNGWHAAMTPGEKTLYAGPALKPFTQYEATLQVTDDAGEEAQAALTFETGRMDTPWTAQWISDPTYIFKDQGVSPRPMVFRKALTVEKPLKKATVYATAMGIYALEIDGQPVGSQYFAPGFTSYPTHLQYQTYDVTGMMKESSVLTATVAGGWAVGSFVFTRKNRYAADRQALLAEIRLEYEDGEIQTIGTDNTWQVTEDGPVKMADLYDGETYDATVSLDSVSWKPAAVEEMRVHPKIEAQYGLPVTAHEALEPVSVTERGEEIIYDFGQNCAGIVCMTVNASQGQKVTVRHAEILNPDGSLNTAFLRTAKATLTYTCREGEQTYAPRFTYMGFRYISVTGITQDNIQVRLIPLYSDVMEGGGFTCSDERLNQLQRNILWGARSNFVDIPTDCPQRDERMGWTGDIAVFGPTACFNFDMVRFLEKWLKDMRAEQNKGGGIPNTVPVHLYGFPATMPRMAIDWWGDASVLVPWALYQATGDKKFLEENYEMMKKYVKACRFWAGFGVGKYRYIWHTPATFHFGDWVAPDVPKMQQWQARSRWTATASLFNTSHLLSQIAAILGNEADEQKYAQLAGKVKDAYISVFTDGQGKLKQEFQTAYVLPLQFHMFGDKQKAAAQNLKELVQKNDFCIGTGFPGTPYILFALADNGQQDAAFSMLMNEKCPSWLYEVKAGATTIWERWDGLDENGQCPIGNDGTDAMISYNHYASGAVGDFLYRRVAGLEPTEPGYRKFRVKPMIGGGLTCASAFTETPFGKAAASWKKEDGMLTIDVTVPVGAECEVILPDGERATFRSGTHQMRCKVNEV